MAGGKQSSVRFGAVLVACLAAALIQSQTSLAATSHTVGGNSGWTIPSPSTLYSTWASQQTFKVGDSLVFNFQTGAHTVAEVTKSAYDACTTSSPISTATTGPATIKIATAGTHYYICTISGHCNAGQKLAITATGSSSAAPTSAPTAAPTSAPTATPTAAPTSAPTAAPTSSPTAAPTSSPTTAPTPSSSGGSATSPSGSATPGAPAVPSAGSPSGGATAPPPSSATLAGAGLVMPLIMIAAAFLV